MAKKRSLTISDAGVYLMNKIGDILNWTAPTRAVTSLLDSGVLETVEKRVQNNTPRIYVTELNRYIKMRQNEETTAKKIAPYEKDLGWISDRALGRKSGLSSMTIHNIRKARGIPPVGERKRAAIDAKAHLLPTMSDGKFAAMVSTDRLKVSKSLVRNYRHENNISYNEGAE